MGERLVPDAAGWWWLEVETTLGVKLRARNVWADTDGSLMVFPNDMGGFCRVDSGGLNWLGPCATPDEFRALTAERDALAATVVGLPPRVLEALSAAAALQHPFVGACQDCGAPVRSQTEAMAHAIGWACSELDEDEHDELRRLRAKVARVEALRDELRARHEDDERAGHSGGQAHGWAADRITEALEAEDE